MSKVTPFLMFNDQLEAEIEFYVATFPDSEIKNVARSHSAICIWVGELRFSLGD